MIYTCLSQSKTSDETNECGVLIGKSNDTF